MVISFKVYAELRRFLENAMQISRNLHLAVQIL